MLLMYLRILIMSLLNSSYNYENAINYLLVRDLLVRNI